MSDTPEMELHDKITALRKERSAHQTDESDYTAAVIALVQAEKEKALRSLVEDAIEHRSITVAVGEQYDNPYISIERLKECLARALGGEK